MRETEPAFSDKAKEGLCGTEFPSYDGEFYVPEGFIDISFAKDVVPCPTIMDENAVLVVRQDFAAPSRRVMGGERYRVDLNREELLDAGYESVQPIFSSEDFQEALSFAKGKLPELKETVEEVIADERREKILAYGNTRLRNVYDDFMAKSHAVAVDALAKRPIYLHKDDCTVEAAAMMLLEGKFSKSDIFRAFRASSPLAVYPGREDEAARSILETVEKQGAEKYVSPKFLGHLSKRKEAAR